MVDRKSLDRERLMSLWISEDIHSIADLNSGDMSLKNMLPGHVNYIPVNYQVNLARVNLDEFNDPPQVHADCCFINNTLEYVAKPELLLEWIKNTGCKYVFIAYLIYDAKQTTQEEQPVRQNEFSFNELLSLFYRYGFILTAWYKHEDDVSLLHFEKVTPFTLTKNYFCTGCSACAEACPTHAMTMHMDANGFQKPIVDLETCINCNKCIKSCHVLYRPANDASEPIVYAFQGQDKIRQQSTSGGVFYYLAKKVLDNHGIVFGASWSKALTVAHRSIERIEDIHFLQHSKYIQSDIGICFQEAERFLKQGRKVLFSGTPCQIAGLKAYLGKDYENLLTVDLLCQYVPSTGYWQKYLQDNFNQEQIKEITFRAASGGWKGDYHKITFSNDTECAQTSENDYWQKGYHPRLFMNDTCEHCRYADYPRIGDITIGDYWDKKGKKDWDDDRGTSEVILNTLKGRKVFASIQEEAKKCEQQPIETTYWNRIKGKYLKHPEQGHFLELLMQRGFNHAVDAALNKKFSIGLVGDWAVENYGANITYYALYSVLHDQMEKDVLMIERPGSAWWEPKKPPTLFMELPYPKYAVYPYTNDKAGMYQLNDHCDTFILGSDQLWNIPVYNAFSQFADLHWVNNDHRKIAYATSFGNDFLQGTKNEIQMLDRNLNRFDAISVREQSGIEILKENFHISGTWVLDPVFLCQKEKYEELALRGGAREREKEEYLFSYMLDINAEKVAILKKAALEKNVNLVVATDAAKNSKTESSIWQIPLVTDLNEEEWLAYFIHAKYIVTDSFHGMCMAIIFHRPFIAILNSARGAARFYSLLSLLGLEDHLIINLKQAENEIQRLSADATDWGRVDQILIRERKRSLVWLQKAMQIPVNRKKTTYDLLAPSTTAHDEHIQYIDNFSYIDVLPSQAASGCRTRFAIGDQCLLFQVWDKKGNNIQSRSIASQQELQELKIELDALRQLVYSGGVHMSLARRLADLLLPKGSKKRELLKKIMPRGSRQFELLKKLYHKI